MYPYRPGDIVRVHNYPYIPKAMQEKLKGDLPEHKLFEGKGRFGVVLSSGGKNITTVPIMQIMSHGGKTKDENYILRDDEIRMPENIFYQRRTGKKHIDGVIKTERIELFSSDEITAPLTRIPLRTKLDLISRYEAILKKTFYKDLLNKESPEHKRVMNIFKESVLAEKLNFLVTDDGRRKFDYMKNSLLTLDEIQPLGKIGKNDSIGIYSVKLKGKIDTFTYTIGTLKSEKQIAKDWSISKKAYQWLSEDIKYNILKNDIDKNLKPDPLSNTNNYIKFDVFSDNVLNNEKKRKNDLEI